MKLLLTSSGISNPSIDDALVGLLGKPIAESSALKAADVQALDVRWTPQPHIVAGQDNGNSA
jgi:hypothetical protein